MTKTVSFTSSTARCYVCARALAREHKRGTASGLSTRAAPKTRGVARRFCCGSRLALLSPFLSYFSCSIQLNAQAMATPGSTRPVRGTSTDGAHAGGTKG